MLSDGDYFILIPKNVKTAPQCFSYEIIKEEPSFIPFLNMDNKQVRTYQTKENEIIAIVRIYVKDRNLQDVVTEAFESLNKFVNHKGKKVVKNQ